MPVIDYISSTRTRGPSFKHSFLAFEDNFHGFFPVKNIVTFYSSAQWHNISFHKFQKVFLLLEQGESFWKY